METSDIKKMCLSCMHMGKEEEFCPVCGKDKKGSRSYGRALEPGTILNGKILIGNILGMGNFGITYMGFDMLLEYRVAVKEFFPDEMVEREDNGSLRVADEADAEEFEEESRAYQREARILAQFSKYPGIVSIRELFYENNTGYMVMEFLEGGTLRRYIDTHGGKIPAEDALMLMEPVISSMEEIHKSGLIHRDISPENIMLDTDGSIKVIDFGATKKLNNATAQVYFGKFGYAPLEQMVGTGQGPWTDVYGICATLYCMITGDIPTDAFQRSMGEPLTPLSEYNIPIEKSVEDAIMKGLSMETIDRQQDMGQLRRALYGTRTRIVTSEDAESGFPLAIMIRDKNKRVWFGHYPMNELTGPRLTTDIIYANYRMDGSTVIEGKSYRRFAMKDAPMSKDFRYVNKARIQEESRRYRIFESTEIPWLIMHSSGDKLILQSEYVLDYRLFDESKYMDFSEREIAKIRFGISWETSKIREWLNRDFFREAFTPEEQSKILIREVNTPISSFTDQVTYDRIFLPSAEETVHGFDSHLVRAGNTLRAAEEQKQILFSQYAAARKVDEAMPVGYGLRTRGTIDLHRKTLAYGESCEGHSVQNNGEMRCWRLDVPMGIRPIIYVDASEIVDV